MTPYKYMEFDEAIKLFKRISRQHEVGYLRAKFSGTLLSGVYCLVRLRVVAGG